MYVQDHLIMVVAYLGDVTTSPKPLLRQEGMWWWALHPQKNVGGVPTTTNAAKVVAYLAATPPSRATAPLVRRFRADATSGQPARCIASVNSSASSDSTCAAPAEPLARPHSAGRPSSTPLAPSANALSTS